MRPKQFCIVCNKNNVDSMKTLWRFPTTPEARKTWIKELKLEDTKISAATKVCDLHFTRNQFFRCHLKRGAVPSLNARLTQQGVNIRQPIPITPRPSQNGLVLLLAAPPVPLTPVPVLQLPPNQTASSSTKAPKAYKKRQSKKKVSDLPYGDNVPPENESEELDPIPESLMQFLQFSLKKKVAEKVLKNLQSVKRFCGKLVSEIESADQHNNSQSQCQQPKQERKRRKLDDGEWSDEEEEDYLNLIPEVKLEVGDPLEEQKNIDVDKDEVNGENHQIKTEVDSADEQDESVLGL
ncbi:unnamed protein product [Orchesella dallaii]|uniref:THAP-type domain-containing protein n=1 Tax=Orchesella dallaii TaxID=48710 RepID=A0ABP1R1J7_9HEXA